MKKIFSILILFIAVSAMQAQDFRKATWGMTKSQVKATESLEIVTEDEDNLIYETTLAGYDVYLAYVFVNGKLAKARYAFDETHINKNDYISDYEYFKTNLEKKYGEALVDEEMWYTDSYMKNDKTSWGRAISNGELKMFARFANSKTVITTALLAQDYRIVHLIEYSSTDPEINKLEEEKILEDL